MFLLRAFAVWLAIIAVETVHGILRAILLVPLVGDLPARQIGVPIGSLLLFAVASLLIRWVAAPFDKLEFLGGAVYGQPGRRLLARLAEPVVVCQRKQAAMGDDGD